MQARGIEESFAHWRQLANTVERFVRGGDASVYQITLTTGYKKLSYRRGIARCVVSTEILPIATQQCRNYLYDKS